MQTEKIPHEERPRSTFGSLFRDLGASAKNLIRSEVELALAELKENINEVSSLTQRAMFLGVLAAASLIPFFAFLVIGLGELLEGRYWLSSLIVTVVWALATGVPAYLAYRRLKDHQLGMPRTKAQLAHHQRVVKDQMENLKDATNASFRRAV